MASHISVGVNGNPSTNYGDMSTGQAVNGTPVGSTSAADTGKKTYQDFDNPLDYLQYLIDSGDTGAQDRLIDYLLGEQSNTNAREWTAQREDTQYQRFAEDMRKAGFNPAAMLTLGAQPVSSSSSGRSYNSSTITDYQSMKYNRDVQSSTAIITGMIALMGTMLIALAMA